MCEGCLLILQIAATHCTSVFIELHDDPDSAADSTDLHSTEQVKQQGKDDSRCPVEPQTDSIAATAVSVMYRNARTPRMSAELLTKRLKRATTALAARKGYSEGIVSRRTQFSPQ